MRDAAQKIIESAVSRQAIYDCNLSTWAYELRYADPNTTLTTPSISSDDNTVAVILSAFAEFGIERVAGSKQAFIHASARTLTGEVALPVPTHRVVLQVNDYAFTIVELVESFEQRQREGFGIALDDYLYTEDSEPLLDLADFVKLDYSRLGKKGLSEHIEQLRRFKAQPVVVNLTRSEDVRSCERIGYKNFQGDFLFKPQVLSRKELPSSFVVVSDLLNKLQDPDVRFADIEELVKRDAGISVAVLKFLNSGAYGFRQEVSSISQAVSLLGLVEFTKWTLLVALSARFNKPSELMTTALVRARTCENYCRMTPGVQPATGFMVGLLSVLDAVLDRSMPDLLDELPVTGEVRSAILEFAGPAGELLERVVTRETEPLEVDDREQAKLSEAWLDAVEWADAARTS